MDLKLRQVMAGAGMAMMLSMAQSTPAASPDDAVYLYASQAGRETLDQREGGGNPFASAVVELLDRDTVSFETFRAELLDLTRRKSGGFQDAEVPTRVDLASWQLVPKPADERRIALVLVFSDYSESGANSLPGATRDMHRVARSLKKAGFQVQKVRDPDTVTLEIILKDFAERSATSDIAVLYTTGHGAEVDGAVYFLPGDYPLLQPRPFVKKRAVPLAKLGSSLHARRANLILYGGCRTNPFTER